MQAHTCLSRVASSRQSIFGAADLSHMAFPCGSQFGYTGFPHSVKTAMTIQIKRPANTLAITLSFICACMLTAHASAAEGLGQKIERVAQKTGNGIKKGADKARPGIEKGAHYAGKGIQKGAYHTEKGVRKGAYHAERGIKKGADKTGKALGG